MCPYRGESVQAQFIPYISRLVAARLSDGGGLARSGEKSPRLKPGSIGAAMSGLEGPLLLPYRLRWGGALGGEGVEFVARGWDP